LLVPAELEAAFAAYNAELAARAPEQRTLREAVTAAAVLYAELLRGALQWLARGGLTRRIEVS